MTHLPITIDGEDFTDLTDRNTYIVTYTPREGPNGGIMLNGDKTVDVLRNDQDEPVYKPTISWKLNALTAAQLARIQRACMKPDVLVSYFDTATAAEASAVFHPTLGAANFAFERHGLYYFRDGINLELEAK